MAADDDNGDGTNLFDVFSASPLKSNDEGSLDIYAGLDNVVSEGASKSCVPFRNCLDLYEEILTEEGTAKEATYNDLQVEYGKCQLQMKELMKKFKEIQTQNFSLKNENQSLKKNISALIKTARVEINRKDEEINNLHQRLSEFPHFRNNHKIARTSDMVKTKDFKSRSSPHLDDCSKTDQRVKSDVSKDVHHSTSPPKLEKEGKSHSEKKSTSHLPPSSEKHSTSGIWSRSHYQTGEGSSNEDNRRGRMDIRHSQCSRGTDRLRKEFNTACGDGEPRNTETSQRPQGRPDKYGKGEPKTENKNSKFKSNSDLDYKNEHMNTSWEKEVSRERSYARVDSQNDKKLERQSERSQNINRKELKSQDREERKVDQKPKSAVKDQDHWRRSERAFFPHSKNEIKSQNSSKYHLEERRGREDCKRDRGVSSHSFSEGRYPSCLSTSRTHKHIDSKEIEGKRENVTLKVERHRTEDKRKRERESKEENRHMRYEKKTPAEHLQKTNKEVKKTTTDLKRQNEPKDGKSEISNNIASEGTTNKELANKGESGPNETKNKDLKLSFMEKLNLTLSPAKKQPVSQDNQHKVTNTPKSSDICDLDSVQTKTVTCIPSVNEQITEETKPKLLEPEALAAVSELRTSIPERKTEEHGLIIKSADNAINCDMPICGTETSFSAPVEVEQNKSLLPSSIEMEQTINGASTTIPVVMDMLQTNLSQNFGLELDTKRTDNLNSCSISEDIEMKETFSTEVAKSNESILQPSIEEAGILPVVPSEDGNPKFEPALVDTELVESQSCHLEPCLPKETLESIPQTVLMDHRMEIGETNSVYHDDENSVLSIDFNHLRPIPEAISPLNSPVRPAAKLPRLESPSQVPLFNSHKDVFPQNSPHSTSKSQSDLNKENQKPTQKPDKCIEADSCKNPSLDELEEGEILSDSENSKPQRHFGKSAKPRVSTKIQSTKTSPGSRKSTVYLEKDNRKTSTKIHQTKSKWNKRRSGSSRSSNTEKKEKIMSTSSLEKIVPIIAVPASIPEVLHMLRVIRKHVRKNYMKFKVKFSLIQFHRIIESAILNFTSLIKHLDLSKISKSVAALQKNLCDIIESKLKQVKKNGIVDRLFEQQLPDMKKKLWKFVDEQLDYLFAKLKKILLKFCDSVNFVSDSDEGKVEKINKEKAPHSKYQKGNVNNSKKEMLKEKSPKLEDSVYSKSLLGCKNSEEKHQDESNSGINTVNPDTKKSLLVGSKKFEEKHQDQSNSGINTVKPDTKKSLLVGSKKFEEKHQDQSNSGINTIKHDTKKIVNTCFDNIKNSHSNGHSLELNCSSMPKPEKNEGNAIEDAQTSQHVALKPERSFEILTEQQASSLTFNLVSDAQMGEIFKSLLQGSDLLDSSVNCNEKNEWELKTPEKQLLETLKCESLPTCTTEELVSGVVSPCPKMISDDNWSLLSSEKAPSLSSGLSLPVHPDVLDESCMFEVASNIALSKDNVCSSEKSKPCISSILLEDLAVSLTVPSPLKSDGHLSFLKPEVLSSSTPEEVISAHFSEDALLEEEDASEQDIHLALESDNSSSKSSCSSSWTSRSVITPGFQYHPNLPMHAVIMEKSNDHFIVKIRRAPPSASPTLKQNMVTDESLASLPGVGKEADEAVEKEYISCQTRVCKSMEELKNSNNNVDSKSAHGEQDCMISTQVPDIYEFLKDASGKADHSNEVTDECFKLHQVWETKVPGNIEEVPSMEEIPNSVEDHLPNTYIDLTKDTVTETKNIGDFIEVTVLSIDQLGCSGDNLNQNAQILDSMQSDAVDAFIDLTQDVSSESKNRGNCPLAIEGLGCQVICVDEDNCKEEKMKVTNKTLECIVRESYIDLTSESASSCETKKSDLKSEPASHSDSTELPGVLDNPHKKRKNLSDINHSQKKQRKETNLTTKEKTKKITHASGEDGEVHRRKTSKKKGYTVTKDPSSSKASSVVKDPSATSATSTSLSAKNVIKKKGEIVVSWTRNDDREILLECQKRAPSSKTFSYLAAKLNKKPYQVSERFQQLKELFEKSKCR